MRTRLITAFLFAAWLLVPDLLAQIRASNDQGEAPPNTMFGASVTAFGDLDGDSWPEIAVSAPSWTPNGSATGGRGRLYILSGATLSLVETLNAPESIVEFGRAIYSTGDIDGDGLNDLAISSLAYPKSGAPSGVLQFYSTREHALAAPVLTHCGSQQCCMLVASLGSDPQGNVQLIGTCPALDSGVRLLFFNASDKRVSISRELSIAGSGSGSHAASLSCCLSDDRRTSLIAVGLTSNFGVAADQSSVTLLDSTKNFAAQTLTEADGVRLFGAGLLVTKECDTAKADYRVVIGAPTGVGRREAVPSPGGGLRPDRYGAVYEFVPRAASVVSLIDNSVIGNTPVPVNSSKCGDAFGRTLLQLSDMNGDGCREIAVMDTSYCLTGAVHVIDGKSGTHMFALSVPADLATAADDGFGCSGAWIESRKAGAGGRIVVGCVMAGNMSDGCVYWADLNGRANSLHRVSAPAR